MAMPVFQTLTTAWNSLHWAVIGTLELIKYLIERRGEDPHVKDNDESTPLHWAAAAGDLERVKYLIEEKGADLHVKDYFGLTPLHRAVQSGHLKIAKYLIEEKGADPHINESGTTPLLHLAAFKGPIELVKYLVEEKGVDPYVKDYFGLTPLHRAVQGGHLKIAKYLIEEKGADPHINENETTPLLHLAAFKGPIELMKYLIEEKGLDPHVKNNYGWTPLHWAARGGRLETVQYLLEDKGADLHVKDVDGWAPLHKAVQGGHLETVKYLLESGADVTIKNKDNETALNLAAKDKRWEAAAILLQNKANVGDLNSNQKRALLSYVNNNPKYCAITPIISIPTTQRFIGEAQESALIKEVTPNVTTVLSSHKKKTKQIRRAERSVHEEPERTIEPAQKYLESYNEYLPIDPNSPLISTVANPGHRTSNASTLSLNMINIMLPTRLLFSLFGKRSFLVRVNRGERTLTHGNDSNNLLDRIEVQLKKAIETYGNSTPIKKKIEFGYNEENIASEVDNLSPIKSTDRKNMSLFFPAAIKPLLSNDSVPKSTPLLTG